MSDQERKQISGETGSVSAGISHSTDKPGDQVVASAAKAAATDAPASEPVVSEAVAPEPSVSQPSISEPALSEARVEAVKAEESAQATQSEAAAEKASHTPGKVIMMPRGDRAWNDHGIHVGAEEAAEHQSVFGKRRIAAIAAVTALATAAGALGGAFATAAFMRGGGSDVAANSSSPSMQASLSRIDTDIQALKSGLDHASKLGMNQFNKTSDRLDKLERAQAEPAAKLAKLSEAVDKLRAAAPVAAAPAAASASKEVTGSIASAPSQQQAAAALKTEARNETKPEAKTEVGRLPTLDDWVLRDVAYGGALIEGRRGSYDVYAGDIVPGLGRVDAIRRQDGRWVVVTSRGLIVAR